MPDTGAGAVSTVGRFAPSPSGDLHVGNLRTAIAAHVSAVAAGGRFLLRVEDLDPDRSRAHFVERQLADLRAIGVVWDERTADQSMRRERHLEMLDRLQRDGHTYPCFCTRADIRSAARAPHSEDLPEGAYTGTCSRMSAREATRRVEMNEEHCLRLRADGCRRRYSDRVQGIVEAVVDDFVVRRRDGVVAYNLAVVVDDVDDGVSEVVRGADLASCTPRQMLIHELLGFQLPTWVHIPLVVGTDGQRLAKRHGAVTLMDLSEWGVPAMEVRRRLGASLARGIDWVDDNDRPCVPPSFRIEQVDRNEAVWDTAAVSRQ